MSFIVAAESYDRFMGRYSRGLSGQMADLAGVTPGMSVLDVGCGPGALTGELVRRVGADSVSAVDPSPPFLEAIRQRYPGVVARLGSAEALPFDQAVFDATLAQLVVHFMADPVAGIAEMRRVTKPGGSVVACVWDHAGGRSPISPLWEAARRIDSKVEDESNLAGARAGHLGELFRRAGLVAVEESVLAVEVEHATFADWWEPITLGVGPAGSYVAGLDEAGRQRLRGLASELLANEPFTLVCQAWAARAPA